MDVADAADSMNGSAGAFARRINARILPRGTSVVDDPTRTQFGDQVLQSTLAFDDEGVTTQAKTLVQDGRIRQVLCSRTPTSKTCTPGNFRGGAVLGSTLLLQSQNALSATDMDAQLTRLAREAELPFALEVERLPTMEAFTRLQTSSDNEWDFGQGTTALRAYKRYPDGRRVAVRNVRLSPIDLRDFRNLAGIGDAPVLYSKPISYDAFAAFTAGFSFQDQRLSFAVPALLFDDLTADSDRKSTRKLPLLTSPNMR
jgi:PmbA/TldA metallopeptidase C-terminal domain